jgi:hypothetical protein
MALQLFEDVNRIVMYIILKIGIHIIVYSRKSSVRTSQRTVTLQYQVMLFGERSLVFVARVVHEP